MSRALTPLVPAIVLGLLVAASTPLTGCNGGPTGSDQFGRILSFDFDIRCTSSGERLVGRVFNVTYNNVGTILSLQATINGRSCSLP